MSVKGRRILLAGLAVLIAAALYAGWRALPSWPRAPADEVLRARFDARLHDFEELRDILLALPQDNVWFSRDQIGGTLPASRGQVAFFEDEGLWHEWESRRVVTIAEILEALGVSAERYDRITDLVRSVDGGSAGKTRWPDGVEVEVGVWGGAGIWGVAKTIVFLDHKPGADVVQSTDSGPWNGTVYARLGRPGWFIHACR